MPIEDPSLLSAPISGAPHHKSIPMRLHQRVYRIQKPCFSFDIPVPAHVNQDDARLLKIDSTATPSLSYVPKRITREKQCSVNFFRVSSYEQIHHHSQPPPLLRERMARLRSFSPSQLHALRLVLSVLQNKLPGRLNSITLHQ